jgi:hypothetical protein
MLVPSSQFAPDAVRCPSSHDLLAGPLLQRGLHLKY